MQAIRPLSVSAGLDVLLVRPEWRDRIDTGRVGAFGISQGGETLMLLGGAQLNYDSVTFATKRVTLDARVRAAVGYVPYFGVESAAGVRQRPGWRAGRDAAVPGDLRRADPIAPPDRRRARRSTRWRARVATC